MTSKSKKKRRNPVQAYLSSAFEEFGKVTWPTQKQTALLTALTLVISLVLAAFIGGVDFGFSALYDWLNSLING